MVGTWFLHIRAGKKTRILPINASKCINRKQQVINRAEQSGAEQAMAAASRRLPRHLEAVSRQRVLTSHESSVLDEDVQGPAPVQAATYLCANVRNNTSSVTPPMPLSTTGSGLTAPRGCAKRRCRVHRARRHRGGRGCAGLVCPAEHAPLAAAHSATVGLFSALFRPPGAGGSEPGSSVPGGRGSACPAYT